MRSLQARLESLEAKAGDRPVRFFVMHEDERGWYVSCGEGERAIRYYRDEGESFSDWCQRVGDEAGAVAVLLYPEEVSG